MQLQKFTELRLLQTQQYYNSFLKTWTQPYLVLVDEFGKGTSEIDGQALLGACIDHWCQQGSENSPFILVSTHFHSMPKLLNHLTIYVDYQTLAYEYVGEELVYYYKLKEGYVQHSEANHIARRAGLDTAILERSKSILESFSHGVPIPMKTRNEVEDLPKLGMVSIRLQ